MQVRQCLMVTVLGGLMLVGCSSSRNASKGEPGRAEELQELATILPLYSGQFRKGPSKVADLAPYEQGAPLAMRALRAGDLVVVWGATMPGEGEGGGTEAIVAYEKKTPTEGGYVLQQNGKVMEMTAAEFGSAPKAK